MSKINNGEEDNYTSDTEEKNPREKNSTEYNYKSTEKETFENSEDNLKDEVDRKDTKVNLTSIDGDGIGNVEVIIQTVHTLEKNQDTIIALPDNISETTMTSSKTIEKPSSITNYGEIRISRSVPNNFILVPNSNGPMSVMPMETIEMATPRSERYCFHRKDYQVMLFLRGVGGGVKPGCVLNRLSNMVPGRYGPVNCNIYITHVMFLLFVMLLMTAFCLNYNLTRPRARFYYYDNWWQIMISCLTAILFLNYLMFSYMMERYVALNYICLILAVIACSMFVSAISARLENDALWIANAMTAATVLFLFLLSFANVDFTQRMFCLFAVLFSLFSLMCIVYFSKMHTLITPYTSQVLCISAFLGALRVFLMVIELQRLLCSCVASQCCDHAFGAFILYTLYLQFIFFLFQWFPLRRNC